MTQKKARELMEEARTDINSAWSDREGWTNDSQAYLLSAIAESIMALTEAILDADPKDEEKLLEKLQIEGRR